VVTVLHRDGIGGLEPDATNVAGQAIGFSDMTCIEKYLAQE